MYIQKQWGMSTVIHHVNSGASTTTYSEDITDAELLAASQEIEETLQTIEIFEHFNNQLAKPNRVQNVDLPVVHNPDGSMSVEMTFEPSKGFVNCTCNAPVSIVMK